MLNKHLDLEKTQQIAKELNLKIELVEQAINSQFLMVKHLIEHQTGASVKISHLGKFTPIPKALKKYKELQETKLKEQQTITLGKIAKENNIKTFNSNGKDRVVKTIKETLNK